MHAIVHGADVQDRDGGVLLMATLFGLHPFLLKLYADGGYQGAQFQDALGAILKRVNIEIVKRSDQAQRFVVLPKRWIVERTFAWLGRCRRLAKDWECLNRKALAFLKLASIRLMTRKLCNSYDVLGQTLRTRERSAPGSKVACVIRQGGERKAYSRDIDNIAGEAKNGKDWGRPGKSGLYRGRLGDSLLYRRRHR